MSKDYLDKLQIEIEILTKVDHPNILQLVEIFQDLDFYYIVTEFCEGGDLFDYIQEKQVIPEA